MKPDHLHNPFSRIGAAMLTPFYRAAVAVRNAAFDLGLRRPFRAHVPVISIGNLTAGGTGKTPMTVDVAKLLQDSGFGPAVLLRGYMRDGSDASDEADLFEDLLPEIPILANPNRVASARQLQREHPEVSVILLDDGFQHRQLHRDLDVVLIDATNPFGYERLLPRGLLREPCGSLRRGSCVVVTRSDLIDAAARDELDRKIEQHHRKRPVAHATHEWVGILDERGECNAPRDTRVFAFAAIGNARAFVTQASARFALAGSMLLPDHSVFTPSHRDQLRSAVRASGAQAVLTTEKDWVKLRPLLQSDPLGVPCWRPRLRIGFLDGEAEFHQAILSAAGEKPKP